MTGVTQNQQGRRSAIDDRTRRHEGYRQSQRRRQAGRRGPPRSRGQAFGWTKTVGAGGKLRYLGQACNTLWFELTAAAYNLTHIANLVVAAA